MHELSIKILQFFQTHNYRAGAVPEQPFFNINFIYKLNPLEKDQFSSCVNELVDAGILDKGVATTDISLTEHGVRHVYSPKFLKQPSKVVSTMVQNFNFNGTGHNIQIGDYNTQQIVSAMSTLAKAIDQADIPEDQKNDAKSALTTLLTNPTITGLIGPAIEGVKALLG